jgi:hypothetical protein
MNEIPERRRKKIRVSELSCYDHVLGITRSVAQLVEYMTLNHGVEGSIPSGPTRNKIHKQDLSKKS